jgi:hypothetical protein
VRISAVVELRWNPEPEGPGSTAFAVIPSLATSFAKPLMNPMIPIFVVM